MNRKLIFQDPVSQVTPLLAVFAVDIATGNDATPSPALLTTSSAISDAVSPWLASGEFKAGLAETLLLHAPSGVKAERLLIIGLGNAASFSSHEVRKAAGVAVRVAKERAIQDVTLAFPEDQALSDEHLDTLPCNLTARAMLEGALLADFDIDIYRSQRKDTALRSLTLVCSEQEDKARTETQCGFDEGIIVAESQNFARALVNEPGNILTPTELGRRAKAMADDVGLQCEVHSTAKLKELGMGAFLAVAQGSAEAPALIVMRYEPATDSKTKPAPDAPLLALVG
jgi:leucyl aminopeptidase